MNEKDILYHCSFCGKALREKGYFLKQSILFCNCKFCGRTSNTCKNLIHCGFCSAPAVHGYITSRLFGVLFSAYPEFDFRCEKHNRTRVTRILWCLNGSSFRDIAVG
jgi:hypothetical protein